MSIEQHQLPFPLVQSTWKKAMDLGEGENGFGHNFYKNLFAKHPALLETLFKNASIDNQKKNLPKSITAVLGLLTDMPKAVNALQQLGMRHILYGTPAAGYPIVGEIVVFTLEQILGDQVFTAEAKAEWIAIYSVIQNTMIDAGKSDRAAVWWQRYYAKRAKELQAIILAATTTDSSAISKSVGASADIAKIANEIAETKSITGPCGVFASGMSSENLKNLSANLVRVIDEAGRTRSSSPITLNAYDKMVLDWFASAVQDNVASSSASTTTTPSAFSASESSLGCTQTFITGAVVFAAAAIGAWLFLKKK